MLLNKDLIECKILRDKVEKKARLKPHTPKEFNQLADKIHRITSDRLSATTLKRFWGYLRNESPMCSCYSLSVLSRYVGFDSWQSFTNQINAIHNNATPDILSYIKELDKRITALEQTLNSKK